MTVVLATYNIKGGVGKTSAAVNLAYLAARGGAPTLLWDLDPQGASTYLFRIKPKVRGGGRKLLRKGSDVAGRIKGTDHEGLDLLPADFSYRHMDLALDSFKRPTRRLARVLEPLRGEYEYVFLDCPPSISLVSESVFEAADALLVPIIPATLSSRTFEQLEELLGGGAGPDRGASAVGGGAGAGGGGSAVGGGATGAARGGAAGAARGGGGGVDAARAASGRAGRGAVGGVDAARRAPGGRAGAPAILAFFSMVDRRKRLHREVMERLQARWAGSGLLETAIPASAEIERMGLHREVVAAHAPHGRAAEAYDALWAEVVERLGAQAHHHSS